MRARRVANKTDWWDWVARRARLTADIFVSVRAGVREKIKEAAEMYGHDPKRWPYVQLIGDLLRATVVIKNFDLYANAWTSLSEGFDVRDGNGRIKNNL